jgi:kynureninase
MENTRIWAKNQDKNDPLRQFRRQFHFPKMNGKNVLYFCGNSLGLQPKTVRKALLDELNQWKIHGVEGHFRSEKPWMYYHKFLQAPTARLVGARENEVIVMNTLTTNLHLLMVGFYRPTKSRFKILVEAGAFPSDQYAVETQVRWHGFDPEEAVIELKPRDGEWTIRTEDILQVIDNQPDTLALVMLGGVNYMTGQFFDLEKITAAAHRAGAIAGFDLAHAAGNVPLKLHDWGCDFAVWCSYKYLNSGPGGPGGVFVHDRHANSPEIPRFGGWWGHDENERFLMKKGFRPMSGAAGWQLSNAQIFPSAAHLASLEVFDAAGGMEVLRKKSEALSAYMLLIINELCKAGLNLKIISPEKTSERGCQISLLTESNGREIFHFLEKNGVICDWREAHFEGMAAGCGIIRISPVPLYNSFEDCFELGEILKKFIKKNEQ